MNKAYSSRRDMRLLFVLSTLLDGDVLANQTRNLVSLIRLNACHSLLHQIATLHVQKQNTVLRFDFPRRNDFGKWIM